MKSSFIKKTIGVLGVFLFAITMVLGTSFDAASSNVATATVLGAGAVNGQVFGRAKLFLDQFLYSPDGPFKDLTDQTKKDIAEGRKVLETFTYYFRKEIDKAGIVDVIKNTDDETVGYRNFDKGKFGADVIHIMTDLMVGFKYVADGQTADTCLYSNMIHDITTQIAVGTADIDANTAGVQTEGVSVQRIPTKVVNSEFKLYNGQELLVPGKTSDLLCHNLNGVVAPSQSGLTLEIPKVMFGSKPVLFQFEFPSGGSALTDDLFVELNFVGLRIRDRK